MPVVTESTARLGPLYRLSIQHELRSWSVKVTVSDSQTARLSGIIFPPLRLENLSQASMPNTLTSSNRPYVRTGPSPYVRTVFRITRDVSGIVARDVSGMATTGTDIVSAMVTRDIFGMLNTY